jgi:transcriptional regulator with XRE-family HTH domain
MIRDLTAMSAASLDRWEKGESGITVDNLVRLAEAYQIQPTTLLRQALSRIEAQAS